MTDISALIATLLAGVGVFFFVAALWLLIIGIWPGITVNWVIFVGVTAIAGALVAGAGAHLYYRYVKEARVRNAALEGEPSSQPLRSGAQSRAGRNDMSDLTPEALAKAKQVVHAGQERGLYRPQCEVVATLMKPCVICQRVALALTERERVTWEAALKDLAKADWMFPVEERTRLLKLFRARSAAPRPSEDPDAWKAHPQYPSIT